MFKQENIKIHFFYVTFILLSVIILLIVANWGGSSDLLKYFSFATALTSLILAVLAIIYSYVSNSTLQQNLSLMNSASDAIQSESKEMIAVSKEIKDNISCLPDIHKKVSEIPSLLSNNNETIDIVDDEYEENNLAVYFIDRCSIWGLVILYLSLKAKENNKIFDIQKMSYITAINSFYIYGFIVATHCTGLVEYKMKQKIYTIIKIDEKITEDLVFNKLMESLKDKNQPNEKYNDILKKIDIHFKS